MASKCFVSIQNRPVSSTATQIPYDIWTSPTSSGISKHIPWKASSISTSEGLLLLRRRQYMDMTNPGVQKPHWDPWALAILSCRVRLESPLMRKCFSNLAGMQSCLCAPNAFHSCHCKVANCTKWGEASIHCTMMNFLISCQLGEHNCACSTSTLTTPQLGASQTHWVHMLRRQGQRSQ